MRTIRRLLPTILIALFVAACAGSTSMAPVAPGDATDGSTNGGTGKPAPGQVVDDGQTAYRDDAKIIRTGSMSLEVSDVASALRVARDAIIGLGGYVGASTTSNDEDRPSAVITYRIPAENWEAALDALRGLNGLTTKVVTESTVAVEVTGQVVDLEARIANLRASETALQAIAAKATKITDVLEVQAQLTATRGQIESLTAELKDLSDRSAYATLTVQFNVPIVAVEVAAKGWDPTTVVDEAAAAMVSVLQGLATAGIWFAIVWLPILLVFGALILIVVVIARRFRLDRHPRGDVPPPAPVTGEA